MRLTKALALIAASSIISTLTVQADHDDNDDYAGAVIYVFDPDYAGGVSGTIQTFWEDSLDSSDVTIKADLNFKRVDFKALAQADGNCTGPVTEYKWHIHTMWNQPPNTVSGSASYAQCSKAITGNHYDPNKACGPASEFADTSDCKDKIKDYNCTPQRYAQNAAFCEKGDLSGKYGSLKPNKKNVVKTQWQDSVGYPSWTEFKPTWNIVIHAVCGPATPRLACAIGTQSTKDDSSKYRAAKVAKRSDEDSYEHDGHDHEHGGHGYDDKKSRAVKHHDGGDDDHHGGDEVKDEDGSSSDDEKYEDEEEEGESESGEGDSSDEAESDSDSGSEDSEDSEDSGDKSDDKSDDVVIRLRVAGN